MSKWFWQMINNFIVPEDLGKLHHCAGVKLVGDDNVWKRAQQISRDYPGKPIVIRFINREGGARPSSPEGALTFLAQFVNAYGLRDCWFQTFRNMPDMTGAVAAWDAEMLRLARPLGIKLIVGDFSMGKSGVGRFTQADNPDTWPNYYPVFMEMKKSGPNLCKLGYQLYIGNGDLTMGEGWLSLPLRYRELFKVHLVPNGWGDVEVFGTEAGFDAPNYEDARLSQEQVADAMIALDKEWMADGKKLWGAAAYTLDNSSWAQHGFNMRGEIFKRITAWQQTSPQVPPIVAIPPETPQSSNVVSVTRDGLRLRSEPSTATLSNVITWLSAGKRLILDGEERNGFVKVEAWVSKQYIKGA